MIALRLILVVLVALICVAAGEAGLVVWLAVAPMDVTGSLFLLGVFPVQALVIGVATAVLWRAYRKSFRLCASLFVVVHVAAYAALLDQLGNPPADVLAYVATIAVVHALWLGVFILRRPPAAKGNLPAH